MMGWEHAGLLAVAWATATLCLATLAGWLAGGWRRRRLIPALALDAAPTAADDPQVALEQRLRELETALEQLRGRLERGGLADHREQLYAQAIRMVHRGAVAAELVTLCGLSRSEAELIATMHGASSSRDC
ncbi:MAG: DUF2802 domain-containing protein [Pseudomonadales bacterium]|nr:DUF2802 domain-containing protein [Pseudomonadales bacterium]